MAWNMVWKGLRRQVNMSISLPKVLYALRIPIKILTYLLEPWVRRKFCARTQFRIDK
ncbi:hypothetical protein ACJIZ3_013357 [Penstemon smallii]|uniref:Uncharacterized protein n=1 Tax=Penstemon smallii TaxID=265156 RepID=A0ABD3UQW5_9LAMI